MINMVKQSLMVARFCSQDTLAAWTPVSLPPYENIAHLTPLRPFGVVAGSPTFSSPVLFTDVLAHHVSTENRSTVPCRPRSNTYASSEKIGICSNMRLPHMGHARTESTEKTEAHQKHDPQIIKHAFCILRLHAMGNPFF